MAPPASPSPAALTRPAELGQAAAYLWSAITAATHDVYLALAAVATLAACW
jgi:hypothetical protein